MNKYNKEEQEFLNLFERESAAPDAIFQSRLKAQMLKELEPKFNIFSFINTAGFSFLATIIFSFITVATGFFIISEITKSQEVRSVAVVSDDVKQEVVEKLTEKTSVTALNLLKVDEFLTSDTIAKPTKPASESYNLKTTEVTFIPKRESVAVCSNLSLPTELTVTQLYEYFEEGRSISKLTQNNQTIAVVEFKEQDVPLSFPVSIPVSFPNTIAEANENILDFTNFELIENSSQDQKSFTITDSIEFDCEGNPVSFPTSFAVATDVVFREFILNTDYSLRKVNIYLNLISNSSKLAEITVSASTKNVSIDDAIEILQEDLR